MMPLMLFRRRGKPTLDLSFLGALPSGMTYARASTGWRFNSAGLLVAATTDAPRFDFNPLSLSARGMLVEIQSTNNALYCRDQTNAAWVKTNCTASLNQTGLDGAANSASLLTATGTNATCLQSYTGSATTRQFSVWAKRVTGSGTINITQNGGTTWTPVALTAAWQRFNVAGSVTNPLFGIQLVTSGDAVAVDAAQLEDVSYPTSPILTASSAVTRAADLLSISPFCAWFNPTEGAFAIEWEHSQTVTSNYPRPCSLNDGTNNNTIDIYVHNTGPRMCAAIKAGSAGQVDSYSGSPIVTMVAGAVNKQAMRYRTNDSALSNNGNTPFLDTSCTIPTGLTQLQFFRQPSFASFSGWLRRFRYWNYGLDNATLQQVSQ